MDEARRVISLLNTGYVQELYERFEDAPSTLDASTRAYFERRDLGGSRAQRILGATRLAQAIRSYGHRAARLDPVPGSRQPEPALDPETYGLSASELDVMPAALVGGPVADVARSARRAIDALRQVYCSTRGYDYAHVHDPEERAWLAQVAEGGRFRAPRDPIDPVALLESLTRVELFETFLHRMMPGRFRFSIEGLDTLVPLLEEILGEAAEAGVRSMILGMAHRGRLNVLAHVLNQPYEELFAQLRGKAPPTEPSSAEGYRGDATYHMGARRARRTGEAVELLVTLLPNPSHVEAIDPVVEGMARAAGTEVDGGGPPRLSPGKTLPVLVHGDAAFPGQGVASEALNLGNLPAYRTGGTLHVIANNGLGFTTDPGDLYGSFYASDLAKGFDIPVVHVNADDPESVIEVARTAVAYLTRFRKDFVIDLVGYRRRGHNESDEPRFTQPLRYALIDELPTVREQWGRRLVERGEASSERVQEIEDEALDPLRDAWKSSAEVEVEPEPSTDEPESDDEGGEGADDTSVSLDRLRELNASLLELPSGFTLHPKLRSAREGRRDALAAENERTIDWATAEELAFATLLAEGTAIRLTGEDTERGTFSQRHAVFHDAETGARHAPLERLRQARAAFEIHNSPLSENAALGFEVGYSLEAPERLVLWEAQYGDFANGAQVVIDELVVSAGTKWGRSPALVLLLPHGYEGHGPDHSSARPERFLGLAAAGNLRIANVTTPAQYFHLLRSHALSSSRRPLVLFTPKGLLRERRLRSTPRELAEGRFLPVLDDPSFGDEGRPRHASRLVLCTGKLYADLLEAREARDEAAPPVLRLEGLYPFPRDEIAEVLSRYPELETLVWAQEEPRNMGAWSFLRDRLEALLETPTALELVAREASPSPAEGSAAAHASHQRALVERALSGGAPPGSAVKEA